MTTLVFISWVTDASSCDWLQAQGSGEEFPSGSILTGLLGNLMVSDAPVSAASPPAGIP